jgi:hypothetical protein
VSQRRTLRISGIAARINNHTGDDGDDRFIRWFYCERGSRAERQGEDMTKPNDAAEPSGSHNTASRLREIVGRAVWFSQYCEQAAGDCRFRV